MTSYTPLTDTQLQAGKPISQAKARALRDNPIAITEGASGAPTVQTAAVADAAITRAKLSTTTTSGTAAVGAGASASYTLVGGTYSWWTGGAANSGLKFGNGNVAAGVIGFYNEDVGSLTFYCDERYVQASPPYRYGPLFVTLMVDALGAIIGSQVSPDPIWAYNGPTNIVPQYFRNKRAFRLRRMLNGVPLRQALTDPTVRRAYLAGDIAPTMDEVEITLEYKDSDASVIWHPFGNVPPGATVLLVRPGTPLMDRLHQMADDDHARTVRDIFLDGHLQIDNTTGIALPGTPIQSYAARWKLTP